MTQKYVFVRMRKEDFEKIVKEKKIPMEQDLRKLTGKELKITNTQLFKIAANSTWDFNTQFGPKMFKLMKLKDLQK